MAVPSDDPRLEIDGRVGAISSSDSGTNMAGSLAARPMRYEVPRTTILHEEIQVGHDRMSPRNRLRGSVERDLLDSKGP